MNNQKLSQEELTKLFELQKQNNSLVYELGQISVLEFNLIARKKAAEDFLLQLQKAEADLAKSLEDKYGAGSIDMRTGEFNPITNNSDIPPVEVVD